MNRHERRKRAAQARHQGGGVLVKFDMNDEGRALARRLTVESPAFVASVQRLQVLYVEWRKAHPDATPRWRDQGKYLHMGPLAEALWRQSLAENDAALECLEWLAEREHHADVYAARCAVESVDDQYAKLVAERTAYTSPGFDLVEAFAAARGTTTRTPDAPCPHCGTLTSAGSAGDDSLPEPGHLVVCVKCGGLGIYDDELKPRLMTDAEWGELPAEVKAKLEDAGAIFRATHQPRSKQQVDA